jgi:ppGpp synthetase/RelA/SpoT-type nucleotidyltranferase
MEPEDPMTSTITYAAYEEWYETAAGQFLEPARITALRLLTELLDKHVDGVDRGRFRISNSRVKSLQRSFAKLSGEKYESRFTKFSEVPDLIDDLVGLRLVCNNLSDISTFQELVSRLPLSDADNHVFSVEAGSHRDYFAEPKPSGYRAYHVNVVVPVTMAHGVRHVRVEVQVRTLLQDGWGELTHEDTYKPGSVVPEWIVRMSLRMADLLAAVDSIAQDLRSDLDRVTQLTTEVQGASSESELSPHEADPLQPLQHDDSSGSDHRSDLNKLHDQLGQAIVVELARVIESTSRPLSLAAVTQSLVTKFGTDITEYWSSEGGLAQFVERNVPGAAVTGPMPGYVHPSGSDTTPWPRLNEEAPGVPALVRKLKRLDATIPAISAEEIHAVIESVRAALASENVVSNKDGVASVSEIARLARASRVSGERVGVRVVRPHAQYVLNVLNRAAAISREVSRRDIDDILIQHLLGSASAKKVSIASPEDRLELESWLGRNATSQ